MWIVFFFQAEDGIRDWSVTGVQTCALPIYPETDRESACGIRSRSIADRAFPCAASSAPSAAPHETATVGGRRSPASDSVNKDGLGFVSATGCCRAVRGAWRGCLLRMQEAVV